MGPSVDVQASPRSVRSFAGVAFVNTHQLPNVPDAVGLMFGAWVTPKASRGLPMYWDVVAPNIEAAREAVRATGAEYFPRGFTFAVRQQ